MYEVFSVGKLSETQKSKLRNGHPVRVKKGSGNSLCLSHDQIKKLEFEENLLNNNLNFFENYLKLINMNKDDIKIKDFKKIKE